MESKTSQNGLKTAQNFKGQSLVVLNKDPNYDYSFRRKAEVEQGGGVDRYGYEPITKGNSNGESWAIPYMSTKTKGSGQIVLEDVILCKRPKEVSTYFKSIEDERYNSQKLLIKNAAKNAQVKLRQLDPSATVTDSSSGINFTQRKGPTEE